MEKASEEIKKLKAEIERLKKVNSVLMDKIERGNFSDRGPFALFEKNVALATQVKERTLELEHLTNALKNEKNKLSGIIVTLPGGVIIFDKNFTIDCSFDRFLKGKFNSKGGLLLEEAVGIEFSNLIKEHVSKISPTHEVVFFDYLTTINNKEVYYNCSISSRDQKQYVLYIQDNSEKYHQEKLIKNQEIKILQSAKLASLGEMAAGVAHEINNPLAIINVATDSLKKQLFRTKISNPSIDKTIEVVDTTVKRISKIITVMRNISRENKGFHKEETLLIDIIREVFDLCYERFKYNNIELKFDIPPHLQKHVLSCDRIQISQVLLNLLNNAFDAVNGTPNSWVVVRFVEDELFDIIQVENSGKRIPESIIPKIFNPFFTTKEVGKGTGLGLSISKSIMENHLGSIDLAPGEHTCFVLKLPKLQISQQLENHI